MRTIIYLVILPLLFSCKEYKVYQFNSTHISETRALYCIERNGKVEFIIPDRLNWTYYYNLDMGATPEELAELGSEKVIVGKGYNYQIVNTQNNFKYILSDSAKTTNTLPKYVNVDTCFHLSSPFFELNDDGGRGISNEIYQPWTNYYGKLISDTTYYFESQRPEKVTIYELAPTNNLNSDSCNYTNPIRIFINKRNGLPLNFEYEAYYFDGSDHIPYTISISCNDYKIVRMNKKKIKKLLW